MTIDELIVLLQQPLSGRRRTWAELLAKWEAEIRAEEHAKAEKLAVALDRVVLSGLLPAPAHQVARTALKEWEEGK